VSYKDILFVKSPPKMGFLWFAQHGRIGPPGE